MLFAGAGVLAGAYKGRDIDDRSLLTHATPTEDIKIGRLSRHYGEALCNRSINLVDSVMWEDVSAVTCERCNEILDRLDVR